MLNYSNKIQIKQIKILKNYKILIVKMTKKRNSFSKVFQLFYLVIY